MWSGEGEWVLRQKKIGVVVSGSQTEVMINTSPRFLTLVSCGFPSPPPPPLPSPFLETGDKQVISKHGA